MAIITRKYVVAQIRITKNKTRVLFRAYTKLYGIHLCENLNDKYILWYKTEEEAKKNIHNANECVLGFTEEEKEEFTKQQTMKEKAEQIHKLGKEIITMTSDKYDNLDDNKKTLIEDIANVVMDVEDVYEIS